MTLASILAFLFIKPQPVTNPLQPAIPDTYEQACEKHYKAMAALIGRFSPVYCNKDKFFYQIVDQCTCIEVDTRPGSRGITKLSTSEAHTFFNLILDQRLELEGFEVNDSNEFHYHFTKVENEINICVNQALSIK